MQGSNGRTTPRWAAQAVAVAAALLTLASGAFPQGATTERARRELAFELPTDPGERPHWVGDWGFALDEAVLRNVPVVAILSDERSGFQTMRDAVYSRPEFAKFSRRCVLLAAFDGRNHGSKEREVDGRKVKWCDLFDCPCDDHVRAAVKVRNDFATREFWNPLHVFVTPAGQEVGRVEGHLTTQDQLDQELKRVRSTMGPGLDYDEYRELMLKLRAIVDQREKKSHASAHVELGRLLQAETRAEKDSGLKRVLKTPAMKAFVESLQARLLEEGEGLLEDADDLIRRRDPDGARKLLVRVQRSFRGLPPAEEAAKVLAKLPPQKDR
jgi:hypothetical protein